MIRAFERIKQKLYCKKCHNIVLQPFGKIEDKAEKIYWICPKCNTIYDFIYSLREVKK